MNSSGLLLFLRDLYIIENAHTEALDEHSSSCYYILLKLWARCSHCGYVLYAGLFQDCFIMEIIYIEISPHYCFSSALLSSYDHCHAYDGGTPYDPIPFAVLFWSVDQANQRVNFGANCHSNTLPLGYCAFGLKTSNSSSLNMPNTDTVLVIMFCYAQNIFI